MFTGIVQSVGTVAALRRVGSGFAIRIDVRLEPPPKKGESIAVSGVCLTADDVDSRGFSAAISSETARRSTICRLKKGSKVNLELALAIGDRFGGHLVSGHVDCTGGVRSVRRTGDFATMSIEYPREFARFVAEKGSIAIDGVSLTVAKAMNDAAFDVAVIPETLERTTLGRLRSGSEVNIEFDIIAKYIERIVKYR